MSKESMIFHSDPFNQPELEHTLRGRELVCFAILYLIAVLAIVIVFEVYMPVLFNQNLHNDSSDTRIRRGRPLTSVLFSSSPLRPVNHPSP